MGNVERSEFGQRLFDARKNAKLTQPQLAKKVGLAQSTIAGLERSGQGSSKTLQLATACGVTPEWLATGNDKVVAAPWPFLGIVTPAEWMVLPEDVRDDVLAAAEHHISRHRKKTGQMSGKSSHSQSGDDQQKAA